MMVLTLLISTVLSAVTVSITEPTDGETYDGDWLPLRAIVENGNELPDSVHYQLNGGSVTLIPRLNTDWPTYMQNYFNHGYSESPAPYDNTVLWTAPITGDDHEFPTPVVVDGIVYYTEDGGGEHPPDSLYALDAATGEIIWKYDTGHCDDAVTVYEGYLYSAADDSIFCLNALTGDRIWASANGNYRGSTPIAEEGRVYCGGSINGIDQMCCLNASDGSLIWSHTAPNDLLSCPALAEGRLFVANVGTGVNLYALDADDGSVIWQNTDGASGYWDSSPVVVDGMIYINSLSGYTLAVNAVNGNTEWCVDLSPGHADATAAYFDGRLFFAFSGQYGDYFSLDAADGSTIWTVPKHQHGSSGIADGLVFFGEDAASDDSARVFALDCETGAEIWSYKTGGDWLAGSPSIVDGVVYMPAHDGNLYAFGTGLKYTYNEDYFYADVGANELIITSFDNGTAVAADTISFTVTQTGINLEPSRLLDLSASPNPFHSSASITFDLFESGTVSVEVFDLTGRRITSLCSREMAQGVSSVEWNGCSDNGESVSAGLYLCRIQAGSIVETTGLCLLR